jgi:hypothetical protein
MNGRIRKIVNEVGDLQETAPSEKCNALRIAASALRRAAEK